MSYEAFRAQCAKVLELYEEATARHYGDDLDAYDCANIIRAIQLPEVTQEPTLYQFRTAPDWTNPLQWAKWEECKKDSYEGYKKVQSLHNWLYETRELYLIPPDAEALRKENEQLRAVLDALSKRCYIMSESHQVNDVRGARLIVGFNNIVDAGDAHSAISALKGGAA